MILQIIQEYSPRLENIRSHFPISATSFTDGSNEIPSAENTSPVFELNIALQDLQK